MSNLAAEKAVHSVSMGLIQVAMGWHGIVDSVGVLEELLADTMSASEVAAVFNFVSEPA